MPELTLSIDARGAKAGGDIFVTQINRISQGSRRGVTGVSRLNRAYRALGRTMRSVSRQLNPLRIRNLFAAFGAFKAIKFVGQVERIENAFTSLVKSGRQGVDGIVRALERGSEGTISRFNAMLTANRAMIFGVGKTEEEFEKLSAVATKLGRAMNQGPIEAFNDLVLGVGRQSRRILDNIGILVRVDSSQTAYAESLGKTVDELTDVQKKQGFLNGVLENSEEILKRLGKDVDGVASNYERLQAAISNIALEAADAAGPALTDMFKDMTAFVREQGPAFLRLLAAIAEGFAVALALWDNSDLKKSILAVASLTERWLTARTDPSSKSPSRGLSDPTISDTLIGNPRVFRLRPPRPGAVEAERKAKANELALIRAGLADARGTGVIDVFEGPPQLGSKRLEIADRLRAAAAELEERLAFLPPGLGPGFSGVPVRPDQPVVDTVTPSRFSAETLKDLELGALDVGDAFGRAFGDATKDINDMEGAARRLLSTLQDIAINVAIEKPISRALTSFLGKSFRPTEKQLQGGFGPGTSGIPVRPDLLPDQ